jgi:CheY-like chemotaxis protein
VGQGTTFDIYFPVVEDKEEMLEEEEQAPEDVTSVRVLFVDDEESLAELYTKTLQSFGHSVVAVTSPTEAIRLLKRDPAAFDIVITDLTMPKLTGVKMAIQMQSVSPGIPVILCSGYSENVDRDLFEEAGIRDLIIKPIATMKLVKLHRGHHAGEEEEVRGSMIYKGTV